MTAGRGSCFHGHCCKVRSSSSSQTSKSSTNDTYMVYNFGTMVIVIVIANGGGSVGNVRITAFCWRLRGSEHRCHCIKMKSFGFVYIHWSVAKAMRWMEANVVLAKLFCERCEVVVGCEREAFSFRRLFLRGHWHK